MSQVIAALEREHANIEKVLKLLESEILAIEVGKTPDYQLLQDMMCYMTQYPDRFHHPKEELLFAQVLKHEPGAHANIEALLAEHVSIGLAGRNFDKLLLTSNIDSVNAREGLGVAGFAYIRSLRAHMWKEEKKLFELAKAVFTEEDWQAVDKAVDAIEDPLFGTVIANGYGRLYRLITDG
jgi:hemerythrin-like domain-containing protein